MNKQYPECDEFGGVKPINPTNITNQNIFDCFHENYPDVRVQDYRPLCSELFTKNKIGITIFLENGDIIQYYPKTKIPENPDKANLRQLKMSCVTKEHYNGCNGCIWDGDCKYQ